MVFYYSYVATRSKSKKTTGESKKALMIHKEIQIIMREIFPSAINKLLKIKGIWKNAN